MRHRRSASRWRHYSPGPGARARETLDCEEGSRSKPSCLNRSRENGHGWRLGELGVAVRADATVLEAELAHQVESFVADDQDPLGVLPEIALMWLAGGPQPPPFGEYRRRVWKEALEVRILGDGHVIDLGSRQSLIDYCFGQSRRDDAAWKGRDHVIAKPADEVVMKPAHHGRGDARIRNRLRSQAARDLSSQRVFRPRTRVVVGFVGSRGFQGCSP